MTAETAKVRTIKRNNQEMRLTFGSLLLTVFCAFLLVFATFWQPEIVHYVLPFKIFTGKALVPGDFIHHYQYIPQVPAVMFIAALLGRKFGIASIILYIFAGLFIIPVFALGGSWKYVFEYGFGYILAFIPAAFFAGSILKSGFSYRNIAHAVLVGVLTIHVIGIFYMLFISALRHEGAAFISSWIVNQSGIKILYDLVLSFFALLAAKYLKAFVWYVLH